MKRKQQRPVKMQTALAQALRGNTPLARAGRALLGELDRLDPPKPPETYGTRTERAWVAPD
jgi:hypothetical protein